MRVEPLHRFRRTDDLGHRLGELDRQRLDHLDLVPGQAGEHARQLRHGPGARAHPHALGALARVVQLELEVLGDDFLGQPDRRGGARWMSTSRRHHGASETRGARRPPGRPPGGTSRPCYQRGTRQPPEGPRSLAEAIAQPLTWSASSASPGPGALHDRRRRLRRERLIRQPRARRLEQPFGVGQLLLSRARSASTASGSVDPGPDHSLHGTREDGEPDGCTRGSRAESSRVS